MLPRKQFFLPEVSIAIVPISSSVSSRDWLLNVNIIVTVMNSLDSASFCEPRKRNGRIIVGAVEAAVVTTPGPTCWGAVEVERVGYWVVSAPIEELVLGSFELKPVDSSAQIERF